LRREPRGRRVRELAHDFLQRRARGVAVAELDLAVARPAASPTADTSRAPCGTPAALRRTGRARSASRRASTARCRRAGSSGSSRGTARTPRRLLRSGAPRSDRTPPDSSAGRCPRGARVPLRPGSTRPQPARRRPAARPAAARIRAAPTRAFATARRRRRRAHADGCRCSPSRSATSRARLAAPSSRCAGARARSKARPSSGSRRCARCESGAPRDPACEARPDPRSGKACYSRSRRPLCPRLGGVFSRAYLLDVARRRSAARSLSDKRARHAGSSATTPRRCPSARGAPRHS
jgi:hypothetical protein